MLTFYNTLTRKKEIFKPLSKSLVTMYSCGPTVYSYQHIGNLRAYIFADFVKRVLLYNKYPVKHVINVTDVGHLTSDSDEGEDKIEVAAKKEKKSAEEIAQHYFDIFHNDVKKLNILEPDAWPKATENIQEQIELIQTLEKKGYTYKTSDGIYFDSHKFSKYGELAHLNIGGLQEGKRVSIGEKKNKTDFALWKFSNSVGKREQEWKSPWGIGFPGWHIECSAMSMKYLGERIDIHTGGEDHIPVHHTNEIAQSECATGKKFVNYWMHVRFLTYKGKKVSKSTGGLYTLSDLEELGYKPEHFRYLCLLTHYRKPLDFSLDHLEAAKRAYEKIARSISEEQPGKDKSSVYLKAFEKAINDDLNLPEAVQTIRKAINDKTFDSKSRTRFLKLCDSVLGLGLGQTQKIPAEIQDLLREREKARAEKNWKKSDMLRDKIRAKGYSVEDVDAGQVVTKI